MNKIVVEGKNIALDKEGYLINLDDWSPKVAEALAEQADIELTEAHWEIIELLRGFYATYELSPSMRPLVKAVRERFGREKGRSIYLMQLFPGSAAKLASKIAGLPKPTNCL